MDRCAVFAIDTLSDHGCRVAPREQVDFTLQLNIVAARVVALGVMTQQKCPFQSGRVLKKVVANAGDPGGWDYHLLELVQYLALLIG